MWKWKSKSAVQENHIYKSNLLKDQRPMPSKILWFSVKKEVLRDSKMGNPIVSSQNSFNKNHNREIYEIKRGYDLEEPYNLI